LHQRKTCLLMNPLQLKTEALLKSNPSRPEDLAVLEQGLVEVNSMAGPHFHPSNNLWVHRKVSSPLMSTEFLFAQDLQAARLLVCSTGYLMHVLNF
jgi:hypothetical protein